MKRIGAIMLILILVSIYSCGDKSTEEVQQTGLELSFKNCITFAVWLWIDDEYQGTYTSEEPNFIPIGAGSHTLYAKSNLVITGTEQEEHYFCWSKDFSVQDGKVTYLMLDCEGHNCTDSLSAASW